MDNSGNSTVKSSNQRSKSIANNANCVLFGKHSAKGTTCLESAINNLVARVQLARLDRSELESRGKFLQPAPPGKPLKRKLPLLVEKNVKRSRLNNKVVENSRKIGINVDRINVKVKTRPFKNNTIPTLTNPNNLSNNKSVLNKAKVKLNEVTKPRLQPKHHFNGDKHQIIFSGPRVRKPNPKFQDFITSPQVRSVSDKQPKERSEASTVKQKVTKPVKTHSVQTQEADPLDLMGAPICTELPVDDVVRSFLPVMDKPAVLYDSESDIDENSINSNKFRSKNKVEEILPTLKLNEKENKTKQTSVPKVNVKPKTDNNNLLLKSNDKKKLTPNSPVILAPHSVTPVLISPQIPIANAVPIIIATNIIPSVTKDSSLPIIQNISAKEVNTVKSDPIPNSNEKKTPTQPKNETKVTNRRRGRKKNITVEVTKKKNDVRYYLVESEGALSKPKTSKATDVDFNKLVRTLKSVKLPAPNWKIRIVVSRQQTITEVTFTNKEVNERCVKFSRIFTGYVITIGKSVVKLIGAPNKISSFNDVTILLNIIHNLSLSDPILQYISENDLDKKK